MRVCPKCGHSEIIWKHCGRGFRFTDYAHINEVELYEPELATKIKKTPRFYTDGLYNYKLVKAGFIHRIWRKDAISPNMLKEPNMEKPKNRIELITKFKRVAPNQQKFVAEMRKLTEGKEKLLNEKFGETK